MPGRRARLAQAVAQDAGRGDRAAHRGAVFAGAGGAAQSGFEELLSSGVVITGGTAVMHGMVELGRGNLPPAGARRACRTTGGLAEFVRHPRYSTAVGLLFEGRDQWLRAEASRNQSAGSVRMAGKDEAVVQGTFDTGPDATREPTQCTQRN